MVKIRLTRMGKKHQPTYRVVVTPKENPVAGEYLDNLGTYNPMRQEVLINTEKALMWLNKGAQPSERVARLLAKAGVTHKSIVVKVYQPKPQEEVKAETPAPVTAEAEDVNETIAEEITEEAPEMPSEEVTPEATDANLAQEPEIAPEETA